MDVTVPGAMMGSAMMPGATTSGATTSGAAALGVTTGGSAPGGATTGRATTGGAATGGGLAAPAATDPDAAPDPKVWQAAQKFEAMAIGQMLAPMFDTVDLSKSKFGGGQGESAWKPMMIDAIGKQMEQQGGFGLAQPIYAAMLRAQEGRTQQAEAAPIPAPATGAQVGQAHAGASPPPSKLHATHSPGKKTP